MDYCPLYIINKNHFEKIELKPNKKLVIIPNEKATKEDLQSAFRTIVISLDHSIFNDADEICRRMVEEFKACKIYNLKSEDEKKEIIEYLLHHPEIIELYEYDSTESD